MFFRHRFFTNFAEALIADWNLEANFQQCVNGFTGTMPGSITHSLKAAFKRGTTDPAKMAMFDQVLRRILKSYLLVGDAAVLKNEEEFQLIDRGFAHLSRALNPGNARIDEPLALIAGSRWMTADEGLMRHLENDIAGVPTMEASPIGFLWEFVVAMGMHEVFDGLTPLNQCDFWAGDQADWADQPAVIGRFEVVEWEGLDRMGPSDTPQPLVQKSLKEGTFVDWLRNPRGRPIFCPEVQAGPDLAFILQLGDGRVVLAIVQVDIHFMKGLTCLECVCKRISPSHFLYAS